ncbi:type VI secretion system membrane subunit TssM [Psychromonas arctica]|uniref:type VI secretion system membrane subunit TssM n=1 Tax=Psychromonas arctica TaxID=168275 RepID=UPI002FCF8A70
MSFKSTLKKIINKLKSKAVLTTIGLICLALIIWFGGPLIAVAGYEPLLSTTSRLITLLAIALIWGGFHFIKRVKEKKNNEAMVNTMINGDDKAGNANDDAVKKEIDVLQQRMTQAHDVLKTAKLSKGKNVYELPWYIIVGPPGSGKTTAIQHSGLEYPLKEKMGIDMIQGVGGTRNCDWWFTNKAVLIDTAGRYTTHDSNKKQDSRAWQGFLGLLKKHRPVRPINGVIISMGISELLNQTKTERNLHARAIKQRLQEVQNQLGMTFPVYVLFSKCDLIAGFNEFFSSLESEECEQIWGITFPLDASNSDSLVDGFNKEFHSLLTNLNEKVNKRLKNERDQERRRVIYEFPKQLRLLQSAADDFLKEIFSPNAYEVPPMLRGVYLTSATQEGNPIDKLSSSLPAANAVQSTSTQGQPSRSYFIKHLLEDVIFPEKDLATTNKHHDKQNQIFKHSVLVVASLLTIFFSVSWWQSFNWNTYLVDSTEESLKLYEETTSGDLKGSDDIIKITKGLTILRDLPLGFSNEFASDEVSTWGLYQGDKLRQSGIGAYKRALNSYLLPHLESLLIDEMNNSTDSLNYLYLTLKTYLMLYQSEYYEEEDVKAWFAVYFDRRLVGEVNRNIRNELGEHIATLLDLGLRGNNIDNQAIADARDKLSRLTLVERAYQRLKSDYIPSTIPDFKLGNIISLNSLSAFTYQSGKDMSQSIPGLYTFNGFHGIFNIEKNEIVKNLVEDRWVYGDSSNLVSQTSEATITKQLEQKYYQDYIYYWESLLDDLALEPFNTEINSNNTIHQLANAESPIKSILLAVQKNVQLTKIPNSKNAKAALDVAKNASDVALSAKKSRISRLLPKDDLDVDFNIPGKEVERAFKDILSINVAKLDEAEGILRKLDRAIGKKNLDANRLYGFSEDEFEVNYAQVGQALNDQVADFPAPLNKWYASILTWLDRKVVQVKDQKRSIAKKDLNTLWKKEVLQVCRRGISGRYPFNLSATKEVSIQDFNQFFGYGGTLDKFFNDNLREYVDTNKRTWTFNKNIGLTNRSLRVFQRAEVIRKNFFENNDKNVQVSFSLRPLYLDRHISHFKLIINGQELNYRHDPIRSTQFIWNGSGDSETRVIFTPPNGERSITTQYLGEWSLFRLLDSLAKQRPETKNDGQLDISLNGNRAKVLLTPTNSSNPFWKNDLVRFSCPSAL